MRKYFVTATGTGVGKTLVTTSLCYQLVRSGQSVAGLKPIISGYEPGDETSDSALILKSCNLSATADNIENISPWRFAAPISPNMAAEREGREINLDDVLDFCHAATGDVILVEGVGGVCVPLNNQFTVMDWMAKLVGWKILLVAGSYLGSISHTLSAVQAMGAKGVFPSVVIVSESAQSPVTVSETISTLTKFLPKTVYIHPVLRQDTQDMAKMWETMPPLSGVIDETKR